MKAAVLGTWHVHADEYTRSLIENPASEVVMIWDADIEKAKAFAEKHGVKEYTDDLDRVLNCPDIDSVAVCTATGDHPEVITKAAKAGKNIFTEKVLAFTTEDAEMMKKVIDDSGVKFTISYPHRTWFIRTMSMPERTKAASWARSVTQESETSTQALLQAGCHPTSLTRSSAAAVL